MATTAYERKSESDAKAKPKAKDCGVLLSKLIFTAGQKARADGMYKNVREAVAGERKKIADQYDLSAEENHFVKWHIIRGWIDSKQWNFTSMEKEALEFSKPGDKITIRNDSKHDVFVMTDYDIVTISTETLAPGASCQMDIYYPSSGQALLSVIARNEKTHASIYFDVSDTAIQSEFGYAVSLIPANTVFAVSDKDDRELDVKEL